MNSCSGIQGQLNQINEKLDLIGDDKQKMWNELDKLRGEIIKARQLSITADNKSENALSRLNPLEQKSAQAFDLAMGANSELESLAGIIAGLVASIAGLVAAIAAIKSLLAGLASKLAAFGAVLMPLVPQVAGLVAISVGIIAAQQAADNAYQLASTALGIGNAANASSKTAADVANQALMAAVIADNKAVVAQNTANLANNEAILAKNDAATAKLEALTAQNTAVLAKNESALAANKAVLAENKALLAQGTANQAKNIAENIESTLKKEITVVRNIVNVVNAKADNAQQTATIADNKAVIADNKVNVVKSEVVTANQKADNAQKTAILAQSTAKVAQTKADLTEAKVEAVETQIDGMEQRVQALQAEINSRVSVTYDTFRPISTKTDENSRNIAELTKKWESIQAEQQKLKSANSNNAIEIYKVNGEVVEIKNLSAANARTFNELKGKQSEIDGVKSIVTSLSKDVAKLKSESGAPSQDAGKALTIANIALQQSTLNERAINNTTSQIAELKKVNTMNAQQAQQLNNAISQVGQQINALPNTLSNNPAYRAAMINAAASGVCQTTQPGGCMGNKFDGLKANMNDLNALLNGLQLRLLIPMSNTINVINTKLGAQVLGGLGAWVTNIADIVNRSQILNVLTWIATLHNAYFLSNALTQTLFSTISNSLAALGLKDTSKVPEGEPWDVAKIVGTWTEGFFQSIFGVETVNGIKADWKKYSRIYQAAANLMTSLQSIGNSVLSALETVNNYTGKIGNALKVFGVVGEKAYGFMNPNVDFQNPLLTRINQAQEIISGIDSVANEVLSVQESVKQIQQNKQELEKSIGEVTGSAKSSEPPEAAKVKEKEEEKKQASQSPEISKETQFRE